MTGGIHVLSLPLTFNSKLLCSLFHPGQKGLTEFTMSYFQTFISRLTDDTPSLNTHTSSSRNSSNPPFAYPTSPPNLHTRSSSLHSHHTTSPSSSTFHSLTRTLRSYVPSSIHIPVPSAAPSPPLVSRPVSFGRFSSDSRTDTTTSSSSALGLGLGGGRGDDASRGRKVSRQEFERDYEREGEEDYYEYGRHGYGYGYGQGREQPLPPPSEPSASGLARAMIRNRPSGSDTAAPIVNSTAAAVDKPSVRGGAAGGMDIIKWARWDGLGDR